MEQSAGVMKGVFNEDPWHGGQIDNRAAKDMESVLNKRTGLGAAIAALSVLLFTTDCQLSEIGHRVPLAVSVQWAIANTGTLAFVACLLWSCRRKIVGWNHRSKRIRRAARQGLLLSVAGSVLLAPSSASSAHGATNNPHQSATGQKSAVQFNPAQSKAMDLLAALKSNDLPAIRAFFERDFSPESLKKDPIDDRLDVFLEEVRKLRGGAVVRWDQVTPTEASLIYRNDLFGRLEVLTVKVTPESPHYIIWWKKPAPFALVGSTPASDAELAARLDAFAQRTADYDFFAGTVIITKDDVPILARAYGLADRNFGIPNRLNTKIRLGSINKLFTAVAIGQLADEGKITLEDKLSKFVAGAEGGDRITIKQLLMHMSGLGDWDSGDAANRSLQLLSLDDWLKLPRSPSVAPGTAYQYSNSGYDYLGKVIEKASGEDYYSYLEKHVFKPAKMESTSCPIYASQIPNMSRSYQKVFDWGPPFYFDMTLTAGYRGGAAGCAVSTVEDLARFAAALRSGTILRKKTFKDFTTPQPETGEELQALGFQQMKLGNSGIMYVGHGGNLLGNCTRFGMFEHQGASWTFAILSNSGLRACYPLAKELTELLSQRLSGHRR